MEKLMTVEDVAEILRVKPATAYRKIKEMRHMTSPLRVRESDFMAWLQQKTAGSGEKQKTRKPQGTTIQRAMPGADGKFHVPRVRA
jgi:hypothetical protein